MKKLLLPTLVFLGCVNFYGQEKPPSAELPNPYNASGKKEHTKTCIIEAAQIPLLKGVRIGMAYTAVKEVYPEIETNDWFQQKYRVNQSGLFMIPAKEVSNADFRQDLRQLSLNIENDKLIIYQFIFKPQKWSSSAEMIADVSQMFGVEDDYWTILNEDSIQLNCLGFTVYANHQTANGKTTNSMSVHKK